MQRPGASVPSPIRPAPPQSTWVHNPAEISWGDILDCKLHLPGRGSAAFHRCVALAVVWPHLRWQTRAALAGVRRGPDRHSWSALINCLKMEGTSKAKQGPYRVRGKQPLWHDDHLCPHDCALARAHGISLLWDIPAGSRGSCWEHKRDATAGAEADIFISLFCRSFCTFQACRSRMSSRWLTRFCVRAAFAKPGTTGWMQGLKGQST